MSRSSGPVDATPAWPVDDAEARAVLLSFAGRRLRPPLAALLVEHVLAVTIGAGWPVRRAALELRQEAARTLLGLFEGRAELLRQATR